MTPVTADGTPLPAVPEPILAGRVALVTGGAKGIGSAIVATLAAHGANIVVTDTDVEGATNVAAAVRAGGREAIALEHDVMDVAATRRIVREALAEFASLDILVNNAGVSRGMSFLDVDEVEWDRVNDVNAKGTFFACQAVAPHMMARRYGKIVNVSSMAGKEATPLFTHYSASKFAVMAITQGLAKELAPFNINVNAVCPGIVRTPLWDPLLDQLSEVKGVTGEAAFDEFVDDIPLGRPQTPADIGQAVAFLASDHAGNITGEGLNVSGGSQVH